MQPVPVTKKVSLAGLFLIQNHLISFRQLDKEKEVILKKMRENIIKIMKKKIMMMMKKVHLKIVKSIQKIFRLEM